MIGKRMSVRGANRGLFRFVGFGFSVCSPTAHQRIEKTPCGERGGCAPPTQSTTYGKAAFLNV